MFPARPAFALLALVSACNAAVVPEDVPDGTTTTEADPIGDPLTSSTSSTGSTESEGSTSTGTADELESSSTTTGSEPGLAFDHTHVFHDLSCGLEGGVDLYIEASLIETGAEGCRGADLLKLDEVMTVAVPDWSGEAGTFEIPERSTFGEAQASGVVDIEVSSAYVLESVAFTLSDGKETWTGTIDLTACEFRPDVPRC